MVIGAPADVLFNDFKNIILKLPSHIQSLGVILQEMFQMSICERIFKCSVTRSTCEQNAFVAFNLRLLQNFM